MPTPIRYISAILMLLCCTCFADNVSTNLFYTQRSDGHWIQNNVNYTTSGNYKAKDQNSTLYFTLAANITNVPPTVTAAGLADANVVWTDPTGTVLAGKTPAWTFFTNAGAYQVTVSDWSQVTTFNLAQAPAKNFLLTTPNMNAMWPKMTGLTSLIGTFNGNTNYSPAYADWIIPASCTNLAATFNNNYLAVGDYPVISHLTNNVSLYYTFANNRELTGIPKAYPDISTMTNCINFMATFMRCWETTGTVNLVTLSKAQNLSYMFYFNYAMNTFPKLTNMPSASTFQLMFDVCSNATGTVEGIFTGGTYTNLQDARQMFYGCKKLTGNASYFTNLVKHANFTVGTATTNSSYQMFYGCTNLTDWATLSAAWK